MCEVLWEIFGGVEEVSLSQFEFGVYDYMAVLDSNLLIEYADANQNKIRATNVFRLSILNLHTFCCIQTYSYAKKEMSMGLFVTFDPWFTNGVLIVSILKGKVFRLVVSATQLRFLTE